MNIASPAASRDPASPPSLSLYRSTFKAMGCHNEIAVSTEQSREDALHAMEQAANEVLRIEKKYSRYRNSDDSIVSRINSAAGEKAAVPCDPETITLLNTASSLYHLSDGLFDITSGVLRRGWDFAAQRIPSQSEIASLLALVGWPLVELANGSVRLPVKGMEIDFGGFGKEYAADRAGSILKLAGVRHGYVNLGGDIHAIGGQPDGQPWRFGVVDPRNSHHVMAHLSMFAGGVATSGDSERFFERDGQRYCHVISPRTGRPVNGWRSVSVSAESTLMAGAISTIAMLKEADAVAFLEDTGSPFLLVDGAGQLISNNQQPRAE